MAVIDWLPLDVRYTLRSLARAPGFTVVAVLTLSLAMGATTAVFSVVDSVLLKPLSVRDQTQLLVIWKAIPERGTEHWPFSYASYEGMREQLRTVSGLAAHPYAGTLTARLENGDEESLLDVGAVTGGWFEVLGVRPRVGRLLTGNDDRLGAAPVLVLSSGLAERLFGSASAAVGRTVRLSESAYTIVGIAPTEFDFPRGAQAWAPATPFVVGLEGGRSLHDTPRVTWDLVARVAPGFTVQQAREELASALANLTTEATSLSGSTGSTQVIRASPFADVVVGAARPALLLLAGSVLLVLVVAGVNVTTLFLVRGLGRGREMAVRAAIGAGRGRLLCHLAAEALVVAGASAMLAIPIAHVVLRLLIVLAPAEWPRLTDIGLDGRALTVTAVTAVIAAGVLGALATMQTTRVASGAALRAPDGGAARGSHRYWLRHALVVAQVALAALVLSTAGLLVRSLDRLQRLEVGFAAEDLLLVDVDVSRRNSPAADQQRVMMSLAERTAGLPGIRNASVMYTHPFAGSVGADILVSAEYQSLGQSTLVNYEGADATYFATLGLPIVRGRGVSDRDRAGSPAVVVVNETFARLFWPGADPVGRRIKWGPAASTSAWRTVVGLVADTRYREWTTVRPSVYVPYEQGIPISPRYLAVRTSTPAAVAGSIREAVADEAPGVAVVNIRPLPDLLAAPLARPRFLSALVTSFAALGLALSVIGTYGVVAFFVRQRMREIGLRIALGARPSDVRRFVVRHGVVIGTLGVVIGTAGAAAAGRVIQPLLFGVRATDPLVLGSTAAALLVATLAAALGPSRLATRTDPMIVMRSD